MLCNRSASLTIITRISPVIAKNICCKSSAFTSGSSKVELTKESSAALETVLDTFDTFVSPSTIARTEGPNILSTLSNVTNSVSSTVSCSNPAHNVS